MGDKFSDYLHWRDANINENHLMRVYPHAAELKVGTRLFHVEHGFGIVVKKPKKSELPYCVWLKMEKDDIIGTVDIRLLRWP